MVKCHACRVGLFGRFEGLRVEENMWLVSPAGFKQRFKGSLSLKKMCGRISPGWVLKGTDFTTGICVFSFRPCLL